MTHADDENERPRRSKRLLTSQQVLKEILDDGSDLEDSEPEICDGKRPKRKQADEESRSSVPEVSGKRRRTMLTKSERKKLTSSIKFK